jgi:uncharacterized C2H2 Zn-finger protein
MITHFNDFTLNHTTSYHQLSPDAEEKQSKNGRLNCPSCGENYKDNKDGKTRLVNHVIKKHLDDPNVKNHISNLLTDENAIKNRHEEIDRRLAEKQ